MTIMLIQEKSTAVISLSWFDSSLLPHSPTFNPRPGTVGFVVDKMTMGHVVLQVPQVFLLALFHP
jgi:hypothetical protein